MAAVTAAAAAAELVVVAMEEVAAAVVACTMTLSKYASRRNYSQCHSTKRPLMRHRAACRAQSIPKMLHGRWQTPG